MRKIQNFILFTCFIFFSACVFPTTYRDLNHDEFRNKCNDVQPVFDSLTNEKTDVSRCPLLTYQTPLSTNADSTNTYKFAFLEVAASGIQSDTQYEAIEQALSLGNHFIIVYIHGWRHDAALGNADVGRFHTLLNYSRSFLTQRKDRYPNTEVLGIYLGWRGRSVREFRGFDTKKSGRINFSDVQAALSFPFRKAASDEIAPEIVRALEGIQEMARRFKTSPSENKMMIVGHSLGGNILMTGLKDRMIEAINEGSDQNIIEAPLGDIVYLINPATEASKWISVQREMQAAEQRTAGRFDRNQKPVFVALTNTSDWSEVERNGRDPDELVRDTATLNLFPLNQKVFGLKIGDFADYTAMGHLFPNIHPKTGKRIDFPYGTTHEIVNNFRANENRWTRIDQLADPTNSQCDEITGWLRIKREFYLSQTPALDWDSFYWNYPFRDYDTFAVRRSASDDLRTQLQLRRGLSLDGTGDKPSVNPQNAPYWNVRAHDSVISNHGGFISYPLWCTLNQLILDDPIGN